MIGENSDSQYASATERAAPVARSGQRRWSKRVIHLDGHYKRCLKGILIPSGICSMP